MASKFQLELYKDSPICQNCSFGIRDNITKWYEMGWHCRKFPNTSLANSKLPKCHKERKGE